MAASIGHAPASVKAGSRLRPLMSTGSAPKDWDFTLLPFARLILSLLDAVRPQAVIEVGADKGDFTAELLRWSGGDAQVVAVDPDPAPELLALAEAHPELELLRRASPAALEETPPAAAIILDGDHNHHTLLAELRLIAQRSEGSTMPLLLAHDLGWPHARRDTYYDPDRIPEEDRQPLARDVMVAPGNPGTVKAGVRFEWAAEREGGPRNGTLTAIEDFVEGRDGLRLVVVPAFFGFGALWHTDAPWSDAVAKLLDPFDRNPLVERLEANRVSQIVERSRDLVRARKVNDELTERSKAQGDRLREKEEEIRERAARLRELDARLRPQQAILRRLLNSRALSLYERAARLRRREPVVTRGEIRRVLGEGEGDDGG